MKIFEWVETIPVSSTIIFFFVLYHLFLHDSLKYYVFQYGMVFWGFLTEYSTKFEYFFFPFKCSCQCHLHKYFHNFKHLNDQ